MAQIHKNLVANYAGRVASAILALAFIPIYVDKLGIEAYGLAGLYGTLQSLFSLFDLGFGAALSRRLAWLSGQRDQGQEMRDLTRTFEIYFLAMTAALSLAVVVAAPFIATLWLSHASNKIENIEYYVILMGLSVSMRFPFSMYTGILLGLQRHVPLNIATISLDTLRYVGAVAVLSLFPPTLSNFFLWHIVVGVMMVLTGAALVWRYLPAGSAAPRFRSNLLKESWRFAVGVSGITVTFTLIFSGDKLVLSKVLDLQSFGYYVVASQVAVGISTLYYPVFLSYYPKLTQTVAAQDKVQVTQLFHVFAQLLATVVLPCLAVIWVFGDTILFFWSQDAHLAKEVAPILLALLLGYVANGLWHAPYALQLAEGKTRLVLTVNVLGVLLVLPGLYVLAPILGATGAAGLWSVALALQLVINAPIFLLARHRTIFTGWLIKDLSGPMLAAAAAGIAASVIAPEGVSDPRRLALAIASGLCIALAVAVVSPNIRGTLRTRLTGYGFRVLRRTRPQQGVHSADRSHGPAEERRHAPDPSKPTLEDASG